jgi:siderophore synthetase component/RimJ/RimL family protein N-acetyltransferase
METNMPYKTDTENTAAWYSYTALINCYLRENSSWHRFFHIPRYDNSLSEYFKSVNHSLWIKITFENSSAEIYCPVKYYSETGRHVFHFPVVWRESGEDALHPLSMEMFYQLISENQSAGEDIQNLYNRIRESMHNIQLMLDHNVKRENTNKSGQIFQSFIESEQSLLLGHNMHPVPKSRTGFSKKDLINYSPEFRNSFQLHYFLADPDIVEEYSIYADQITERIKVELFNNCDQPETFRNIIQHYPEKILIPSHPWEALYLIQQEDVKELIAEGKLTHLGSCGSYYSATSSVRTVYSPVSDFMIKFSLHVKITNSERVNLERELYRGADLSRLMQTSWGENIQQEFPDLTFISDPGFLTVKNKKGNPVEGFNTVFRTNIFKGSNATSKHATSVSTLCQDGLYGKPSVLKSLIKKLADNYKITTEEASALWFEKYLSLTLKPFVTIYNKYGLACEAHQQNVLVELDMTGLPSHIYFRDNQGYYFREGKINELREVLPDIGFKSEAVIPEDYIHPKYTYYFVINNLIGVINAFGSNGLTDEKSLLKQLAETLEQIQPTDTTGLVDYLLNTRSWTVKGNLLTNLRNMDEARQPISNPAEYIDYPNPLHLRNFSPSLIKPDKQTISFRKNFPEKGIEVTLRPFDLDRDLELVHNWFNQEHTKQFWKMDGPIRQLEAFYIMLMDSDHSHSFIGEINGVPTFTIEPYWPMRDAVGKYYDALPSDYGAHLLISETEKDKKFTMECARSLMEFVFSQPEVGKCIGEADVNAKAMHMLVTRLGFKLQKVMPMPHKTANLTFCTRQWYQERFRDYVIPEDKIQMISQPQQI